MLADGAWKRLNVTNYITCDDYDGKNSPKRIGLNLKNYFNKVIIQLKFSLWYAKINLYVAGRLRNSHLWSHKSGF